MSLPLMSLDAFLEYLCQYEHEIIGYAGFSFFQSPLSNWLSHVAGRLVSIDGVHYGLAERGPSYLVPPWAQLLCSRLESYPYEPLTGGQVLSILADLEYAGCCLGRW